MTDKEIDKRIEELKKSIAADKADNSWHFIGAHPYIIGSEFLDELFKRLEGAKSENAALREKLEAAVRDIKAMAKHYDSCLFCKDYTSGLVAKSTCCRGYAWRGGQEGAER